MNHRRLLPGLILPGVLAVLLAGCGVEQDKTMKVSASPDNIKNSENAMNRQIIWAMPLEYYEWTDLGENAAYLNELLAEDGYAYQLSFMPLEQEAYDDIISSGRTEGTDIISLGPGAGDGTIGNPQLLLEAGVLYDMTDYLHSPVGSGLYDAFYEKLWDTLTIGGKICVIPNQYGQDGIGYAAFRREIFGDTVQWDGTVEGLLSLADQAAIPEGMIPILWGESLSDISVGMGYEYYNGFFVSLEDGSCYFPYQTKGLQETYGLMNEWYLSGRLQQRPNSKKIVEEKNYAIWIDWQWDKTREAVADEYVFVQFPFTFSTRVNGGIGICEASSNKEAALELLTLLYTQERYANALMWGEPGVTYELTNNFAEYLNQDDHGSLTLASLMIGIFDLVYPRESDSFPVNRRDTKWSLYDTEAERESRTAGVLPDFSAIQEKLEALAALSQEYECIWQEEDMAAAWDEVNRRYEELGGDAIAAEMESLLNK